MDIRYVRSFSLGFEESARTNNIIHMPYWFMPARQIRGGNMTLQ